MPLYAFRCSLCSLAFDVYRPADTDQSAVTCPLDGATATRIFSTAMALFRSGAEARARAAIRNEHGDHSH